MKNITNIILAVILLQACGAVKDQPKNEQNPMKNQFKFEVVIINNVMPSPTPRKFMYAIIKLRPDQGKLANNWKLLKFELNDVKYTTFDNNDFIGQHASEYSTNIREIPKSIEQPCSAYILLENEAGKQLEYSIEDVPIQKVQ